MCKPIHLIDIKQWYANRNKTTISSLDEYDIAVCYMIFDFMLHQLTSNQNINNTSNSDNSITITEQESLTIKVHEIVEALKDIQKSIPIDTIKSIASKRVDYDIFVESLTDIAMIINKLNNMKISEQIICHTSYNNELEKTYMKDIVNVIT